MSQLFPDGLPQQVMVFCINQVQVSIASGANESVNLGRFAID
jgi:hypothetical protein